MDEARRQTRSQTSSYLGIPTLLGLGRGRSRSPSPAAVGQDNVFFPCQSSSATMDPEQIRALVEASSKAAVEAAMATVQSMNISKRKPDLPDFDVRNIEIWIKRVESAYVRANVTEAKEKFAHLEAKIGVEVDPKINEYLYGEANDANWSAFLSYLRLRYGQSKRQQAATILDGVKREGRRPSQLLSVIKEKSASVSIDDLHKELIFRELPEEIQRIITEKVDDLSAKEVAELADKHFDKDGKILIQPMPNTSSVSYTAPFPSEPPTDSTQTSNAGEINAAFRPKQHASSAARGNRGGRGRGGSSNRGKPAPKHSICHFHERFGEKAFRCEAPCLMQSTMPPKAKPEQRA